MEQERNKIAVRIINNTGELLAESVNCLFVPTQKGELAVLPYHMPMLSVLAKGEIKVSNSGKSTKITDIEKGLLRVDDNSAIVLVNL